MSKRTKIISYRVTPEEYERLSAEAHFIGIPNVNEYARHVAIGSTPGSPQAIATNLALASEDTVSNLADALAARINKTHWKE